MCRTLTLAAVLLVPAALLADGETFHPKDGKFTAKFPGKPKENTQTADTAVGSLKVYTATFATPEANVVMVSYTDFPAGAVKPENHASLYDGVKEGLAKNGKVVSEKDIKVGPDKLEGKEYLIDKGKQQTRFRVVVKDNRLYQVAALGTGEFVTGTDATAFLDSFEFAK